MNQLADAFCALNLTNQGSSAVADTVAVSEFGTDAGDAIITASMFWPELISQQKLQADHVHDLSAHIRDIGPVTHVRLNIFPDGGVSRLKLTGRIA